MVEPWKNQPAAENVIYHGHSEFEEVRDRYIISDTSSVQMANGVGEPITEQCCWISPWSLVIDIRLTLHSSEHCQMHGSGTVRATLDRCIVIRHVGIEMGCHPFRLPGLFLARWTLSGSWKTNHSGVVLLHCKSTYLTQWSDVPLPFHFQVFLNF